MKSAKQALAMIDHLLSRAQGEIGSNLTTMETRGTAAHRLGDELFREIEKLRWKIRRVQEGKK